MEPNWKFLWNLFFMIIANAVWNFLIHYDYETLLELCLFNFIYYKFSDFILSGLILTKTFLFILFLNYFFDILVHNKNNIKRAHQMHFVILHFNNLLQSTTDNRLLCSLHINAYSTFSHVIPLPLRRPLGCLRIKP